MANGNDAPIRWSTIGVIAAICGPLLLGSAGYGVMYAKIDQIVSNQEKYEHRQDSMDANVAALNVTIATLAQTVGALGQQVNNQRRPDQR